MSASVSADVSDKPHAIQPPVPGRLGRTFRALQHRDFRAFWLGQVVSNTGTWMQSIAQARGVC